MLDDLPVAVALPAPLDADVAAWAEGDLGWQVVEAHGSLTPALALSDGPVGRLPWIAIAAGALDARTVTALLTAGAEDVVAWPGDRERIPVVATRIAVHRRSATGGSRLAVAGVAGGVGTSTISLAIAGLLAWGGAEVLAVGDDDLLTLAGAGAGAGAGTGAACLLHDCRSALSRFGIMVGHANRMQPRVWCHQVAQRLRHNALGGAAQRCGLYIAAKRKLQLQV